MPTTRYVYLNPEKGTFSNSWTQAEQDMYSKDPEINEKLLKEAKEKGYKIIKYECLNDDDFEFFNQMKLR